MCTDFHAPDLFRSLRWLTKTLRSNAFPSSVQCVTHTDLSPHTSTSAAHLLARHGCAQQARSAPRKCVRTRTTVAARTWRLELQVRREAPTRTGARQS
jgi:hypothetical protein